MAVTERVPEDIEFGTRGVQVRDEFVATQEAGQDKLSNEFAPKINTMAGQFNTTSDEVNSNALSASQSSSSAASYALIAQGSANYKGDYSSGTTYAQGESVTDPASGVDFVSKVGGNVGNALSNSTYWKLATINAGAIGNINNPLLDLPLKNSLAMKQGVGSVTFTRPSTATYIDRYGVLQTTSIDEPRFEKEGLLIEGSSTNLLTHSNNPSLWSTGSGYATPNYATSIDGTQNATRILFTSANQLINNQVNIDLGTRVSTFMYVKGIAGEKILHKNLHDDIQITFTGEWQKVEFNNQEAVTPNFNFSTYEGVDGRDFLVCFGQVETMPFASSYIPTTTSAATRANEVCSIPRDNNSIAGYGNSTTIIDFDLLGFNTTDTGNTIFDAGTSLRLFVRGSTGAYFAREGTLASVETGLSTLEKQRVGVVFEDGVLSIYSNGVLLSSVITEHETILSSNIDIGSGFIGWLFGHFSNYRTYDKALTPSEMAIA